MEDREIVYVDIDRSPYTDAAPLLPHRGDAVAEWLKKGRDAHPKNTPGWLAIDSLLDEYRLRSDLGATLGQELDEEMMG